MQFCSRFTHPYVLSVLNKLKYNSKTSSFHSGKVLTLSAPSENVDYCAQQQGRVYDGVYAVVLTHSLSSFCSAGGWNTVVFTEVYVHIGKCARLKPIAGLFSTCMCLMEPPPTSKFRTFPASF
jgi:hypothetical protein